VTIGKEVKSVLFVCLGNICRSPTAQGVFAQKAQQRGIKVHVDSAGTAGFHKGAAPDKRSQLVAKARGYDLSSLKCRKVDDDDFEKFDYIIAMDNANIRELMKKCPEELHGKISSFMSYCVSPFSEVPDPYYGGAKGFDVVLDLIEQASDGFLTKLTQHSIED
jgi:protein-tyrosine phosphatase